jgi:hypothetical protein
MVELDERPGDEQEAPALPPPALAGLQMEARP